jgi:hypothetical protein
MLLLYQKQQWNGNQMKRPTRDRILSWNLRTKWQEVLLPLPEYDKAAFLLLRIMRWIIYTLCSSTEEPVRTSA